MKQNAVPTYWVEILMAGSYHSARVICKKFVEKTPLCLTIEQTVFIYTGDSEVGFKIRLIHYPKFPKMNPAKELWDHAMNLANWLRADLNQFSYTIMTPDQTFWSDNRDHS